jgi:hypothetical protein
MTEKLRNQPYILQSPAQPSPSLKHFLQQAISHGIIVHTFHVFILLLSPWQPSEYRGENELLQCVYWVGFFPALDRYLRLSGPWRATHRWHSWGKCQVLYNWLVTKLCSPVQHVCNICISPMSKPEQAELRLFPSLSIPSRCLATGW